MWYTIPHLWVKVATYICGILYHKHEFPRIPYTDTYKFKQIVYKGSTFVRGGPVSKVEIFQFAYKDTENYLGPPMLSINIPVLGFISLNEQELELKSRMWLLRPGLRELRHRLVIFTKGPSFTFFNEFNLNINLSEYTFFNRQN